MNLTTSISAYSTRPAGSKDLGILGKALKSHPSRDVDVEDELLQSLLDLPVFQAQAGDDLIVEPYKVGDRRIHLLAD